MNLDELASRLGPGTVSTDARDLAAHARDWWPFQMLRERRGDTFDVPAAVVRPSYVEEVSEVLRWADETRTSVVPFGAGSGVCGGAQAIPGAITLDLRGLNRMSIDETAQTVTVGVGVMGGVLEAALRERGLTLGHFPQSIDISSVGGWLAVRSCGQKSSRYGRIEDMVIGLEVVLAGGKIVRTQKTPKSAAGPDLSRLFLGSEGTLGVITEVTLACSKMPKIASHATYQFPGFAEGLEACKRVIQGGLRPAVCRLLDPQDAFIAFRENTPGGAVLILRFEGDELAEAEEAAVRAVVEAAGGVDLGATLAEDWWVNRNHAVETLTNVMFEGMLGPNAMVDTIEVAGLWPIDELYEGVRAALMSVTPLVGCHASHVYKQGSCLYFTFIYTDSPNDVVAEERYRVAWDEAMRAVRAAGGTISHHHGIGLLRAPWIAEELGEGMDVLRAMKQALDPNGILNPGKMGL
ncbi:MAG: FAD-binding oxidoreductase [Actinomycetota bacterium]